MKQILIVDDEKNIRSTLARALTTEDCEILTAVNGEDALEQLKSNTGVQLVLLDMKMPGMDGIEALRKIRSLPVRPSIVMMTAYGTVSSAVEAMKLGAVDYLSKPFSPGQVREIVKTVLERREVTTDDVNDYPTSIAVAKQALVEERYEEAERYLKEAVSYDPTKPETFNLMGILLELNDRVDEAQKQYRAALTIDGTYKPAEENLHRTTQLRYSKKGMNLGEQESAPLDEGEK